MPNSVDRSTFLRAAGGLALAAPAAPALALSRGMVAPPHRDLFGGISLFKMLKEIPELSSLLRLVEKEARVAHILQTGGLLGGVTLFAPNDDAFSKLPGGVGGIQDVLKMLYSVIAPEVLLLEQLLGGLLGTFSNIPLDITRHGGNIFADEAQILRGNLEGSNGVLHIIDAVPKRIL